MTIYESLKESVLVAARRGKTLVTVSDCLELMRACYQSGKQEATIKELNKQKEQLKSVMTTLDNSKERLKNLVHSIRYEEDNIFSKDHDYLIEDLLTTIEKW